MIRRPTVFLLLLAAGCGTSWDAIDVDGDGFTRRDGDCWDAIEGPSGLAGDQIHPDATETWYDGIDQNCDGRDDYDQDGDGYVLESMGSLETLGVPGSGQLPAGDCWDEPTSPEGSELSGADINPGATETWYDDVDQDCDGGSDHDADGDGWDSSDAAGEDCDDTDAAVNPEASEIWYDGIDQDCDGNDCDADGDGYDADGDGSGHCSAVDCDDGDDAIYPDPSVDEVWYNGVDENCDGNDGDQDGDGYWADDYEDLVTALGGEPLPIPEGFEGDCDDSSDIAYPGATEIWYDGADQGCDGGSDYDADSDSYDSAEHGGGDCDDGDALVNPEAFETWYDGVDQNCDGASDYDADGDGYDSDAYGGDDCDDADAAFSPGATETWYDGIDQDCSGGSDFDADLDGYDSDAHGGDDCDDSDPTFNPGGPEIWYDGADQDCDGGSDYDADYDGYDSDAFGGDDCDDSRLDVYPAADEAWDGTDNDCDGLLDDVDISAAALGWLDGGSGELLGHRNALSSGDVDGDGVTELLLGSTAYASQAGVVWVIDAGMPSSLAGYASGYTNPEVHGSDSAGFMAVMGPRQADGDGDGIDDLVVAGTDATSGANSAVALYRGGSSIMGKRLEAHDALLELIGAGGTQPPTVLSHLDLNADGVAEIVYADHSADDGFGIANAPVFLFDPYGESGTQSLDDADGYYFSWNEDSQLGHALGGGDLDGDGYDDLLMGAPGYADIGAGGFVGVYPGSLPLPSADWRDYDSYAVLAIVDGSGSLGYQAAPQVCDLDADGSMDLVVSDASADAVYVFLAAATAYGGNTTLGEADLVISGQAGSMFGLSLQAGDFTGDGQDDLYIGAPGSDDPTAPSGSWDGALYLVDGTLSAGATTLDVSQASATLQPAQASLFGAGIIGVDLDLDGTLDPIVAAPAHDGAGRVWLVTKP
jgi:hypothetical protein